MSKRVEKWDILKFGLIFLVVLGHICDIYIKESMAVRAIWLCIYTFHMPLFFFVAGLFSKRKINEKQYTGIFPYFAMYIVSQMLLLFGKMIFTGGYELQLLNTKDAPWFIFVLFAYYVITILLKNFDGRYILTGSVVLACIAGYDNSVSDMLQLSRMIVFYPFFYAGYLLDEKKVRERLSGRTVKITAALALAAGIVFVCANIQSVYWIRPLLTGRNPYSALKGLCYPLGGLLRLAFYLGSALIGMMVIAVTPDRLGGGIIAGLGSRSIQVYMLHRPCIILLCVRLQIAGWFQRIWPAHYHLLIIPLALGITLFCSWKIFERPIRALTMPKVRQDKSGD